MPIHIAEFVETPNPNALKCILDGPQPGTAGMRSYSRTREGAAPDRTDPIGAALMAIPEIESVLIHEEWITVVKAPGAAWGAVKKAVGAALERLPGAPGNRAK
ncbi:MAG: NifU N-terminal domain-containing protein [Phycisphaerales bacterium]|jgi:hypothetical protein